jgi:peptidoglycan/xylan/chitin deacetylase (PgdA/CDA1 family)
VDRRALLTMLAGGVVAAVSGCTVASDGMARPTETGEPAPTDLGSADDVALPRTPVFSAPTGLVRRPVPHGTLTLLPGTGNEIALTIDDGSDRDVVGAYAQLATVTGLRLTFFCNGLNLGWTEHAPLLRPLVESGQVFMANHTWSHADLTTLSAADVTEEIRRNEAFLQRTYGVTGRPFLRPPFGRSTSALARQLDDLGYPALTMWFGSLGDAVMHVPGEIVSEAEKWFQPQRIVIGHANYPPVTRVFGRLVELLQERNLVPVHLGDVYRTEAASASATATASATTSPTTTTRPGPSTKPGSTARPSTSARATTPPPRG